MDTIHKVIDYGMAEILIAQCHSYTGVKQTLKMTENVACWYGWKVDTYAYCIMSYATIGYAPTSPLQNALRKCNFEKNGLMYRPVQ